MEDSDSFTHKKTILCRTDPNLSAPTTVWQECTIITTKLTSSTRVVEERWTECGFSKSWRTCLCLPLYSKTYLWVAGTLFYPNLSWKITQSTFSRVMRIQDSRITITFVFFVLLLFICIETNDWKKKTSKNCNMFFNKMDGLSPPRFQRIHTSDFPVVQLLRNFCTWTFSFMK